MPYIKVKYRPAIFLIIKSINDDNIAGSILHLSDKLNDLPKEVFDGALNYTCTQCIRHLPSVTAKNAIIGLISIYYINSKDISYITLFNVGGLLHRMKIEFIRRNWKGLEVIEDLEYYIDYCIANPYEGKKQKENGDLE